MARWQVVSIKKFYLLVPSSPGEFEMKVHCWRPKPGFFDRMIGAYPELFHKDILVSSDSRLISYNLIIILDILFKLKAQEKSYLKLEY